MHPKPGSRPCALVADDDTVVATLVRELMGEAGADVIGPAGDGTQALHLWERHRPHLAVLDFQMPGLTGLDVVRAIRARERKEGEQVPCFVVILSTHDEPSIVQHCLDAGADRFLRKQFDFECLNDLVALVARQRARPL